MCFLVSDAIANFADSLTKRHVWNFNVDHLNAFVILVKVQTRLRRDGVPFVVVQERFGRNEQMSSKATAGFNYCRFGLVWFGFGFFARITFFGQFGQTKGRMKTRIISMRSNSAAQLEK